MTPKFILYNGDFFPEGKKLFDHQPFQNKLFSEELRSIKSQIPFWEEYVRLLIFKFKLHNMDLPLFLQNKGSELKRQIERTLTKNKFFKSAVVVITFLQDQDKTAYLISVDGENSSRFLLNKDGLIVEIFDKVPKAISPLSSLSEGSEPFWRILQSLQKQKPGIEFLLTNTDGSIVEACKKNIYLIKNNQVLTPSASTGAYVDISMKVIRETCINNSIGFIELDQLDKADLLNASEVFLGSSIKGIEWVKGFENKRYFCKTIRFINEEFNRLLIQ